MAEPSLESIELSKKIAGLSESLGLKHILVLNKALPGVEEKLPVKPDVIIPFDQSFIVDSLNGKEVEPIDQIETLWKSIAGRIHLFSP